MKILITPRPFQKIGKERIEELRSLGYEVEYNEFDRRFSKEELLEKVKQCHGVIVGNDKIDKEVFEKAKNLRVIAKYGVGLDNIDLKEAEIHNVKVCKALGANSISVAEMAIQLILAASRSLYILAKNSKGNRDKRVMGRELNGKNLAIIGYGSIGKHVGNIANAMGMKITVYDPFANLEKIPPYVSLNENFKSVLSKADYVTLHLPLTDETKNLIDDECFKVMKNNAVLVNTARAGLIDKAALYNALLNKEIAYVAEDVELKERTEKIISLDNYLITPHAASFTYEADINTVNICVKNVLKVLETKEEIN